MTMRDGPNLHQAKTQATRDRLIAAAEIVFARDGFEAAQLEAIAMAAGRTKGSVYANFKGKEDMFLALFEERGKRHRERLLGALAKCKTQPRRLEALKKFFLDLSRDKTWPLLLLEFKLYSIRHPETKIRLQGAYDSFQSEESAPLYRQVFGTLTPKQLHHIQTSVRALSPIMSALLLESESSLKRFTSRDMDNMISRIFDSLLTNP